MIKEGKKMDRRHFLLKSACFFSGSLVGLSLFPKARASECPNGLRNSHPRIALIIDDIGFSRSRLMQFLEIDVPITFAVLPRLPKTISLAEIIQTHQHEILLHQPMEPNDSSIDPGPGALYMDYKSQEIVDTLEKNISDIPYVTGVNNHMGSRFTSSQNKMNETLEVIKQNNLFFIDSLTTSHSKAYKTAQKLHMAAGFRNIFLDYERGERAIVRQLCRLRQLAEKRGHAIGIGHPYNETVNAIKYFLEKSHEQKFSLVHVSKLIPC